MIDLVEREAEHGGGQERHDEIDGEALRAGVAEDSAQDRDEPRPELPADGEDRAGLDHDLERLRLLAGVARERAGDDQVAGGGDRQEFGEALDDAEQQRGDERGLVQEAGRKKKAGMRSRPLEL